jgi:opacity protein-like surface antigen
MPIAERRTFPCLAGALAVLLVLAGGPLFADTLLTGFAGVAFGGATVKSHGSYGGAIGFLGHGPVGFEVEFGVTPDFFGESTGGIFTSNNVVSGMASLLLATPGAVRIYVAGGGGLMKTRLEDPDQLVSISKNDFGINAGGGLLLSLGDHLSLRGDIRYFRDLENTQPGGLDLDLGHIDYWRGVGGLTLKF